MFALAVAWALPWRQHRAGTEGAMRLLGGMVFGFIAALTAAADAARRVAVDLALVLAVDISGSVDDVEARLQRQGYVVALRDPAVVGAIGKGVLRRIAVTYVEWAGAELQSVVVPWRVIEDTASARTFAVALDAAPYARRRFTSISGAIAFAMKRFDDNGIGHAAGDRRLGRRPQQ